MLYNNFILTFLVVALTTYSQLILRMRVTSMSQIYTFEKFNLKSLLIIGTDLWIISAIGAFGLSFVCWGFALSGNLNVTKTYPVVCSCTILLVSLLNFLFFGDKINFNNILGGGFIIVGIFLLIGESSNSFCSIFHSSSKLNLSIKEDK